MLIFFPGSSSPLFINSSLKLPPAWSRGGGVCLFLGFVCLLHMFVCQMCQCLCLWQTSKVMYVGLKSGEQMPVIWGMTHDYTGLCQPLAFWLNLVSQHMANKVSDVIKHIFGKKAWHAVHQGRPRCMSMFRDTINAAWLRTMNSWRSEQKMEIRIPWYRLVCCQQSIRLWIINNILRHNVIKYMIHRWLSVVYWCDKVDEQKVTVALYWTLNVHCRW